MRDSLKPKTSTSNIIYSDNLYQLNLRSSIKNLEQYPEKKIIITISDLLNNICNENNSVEINNKNIEINKKIRYFMLKNIPSISIKDFLLRLTKYGKICESTLIMMLIYIDRICHRYNFKITYHNIYKLMLIAMVIAIKYNEDEIYSSDFYAKIGGISKIELNNLEYEFVCMIDFKLFISEDLFYKYYELLGDNDSDNEIE
jgi:hypothetical protein